MLIPRGGPFVRYNSDGKEIAFVHGKIADNHNGSQVALYCKGCLHEDIEIFSLEYSSHLGQTPTIMHPSHSCLIVSDQGYEQYHSYNHYPNEGMFLCLVEIYNSDKMWRRLIRSVLEQDLATLRSSQGLIF